MLYFILFLLFNISIIYGIEYKNNEELYRNVIIASSIHCVTSSVMTILFLLNIISAYSYSFIVYYNIAYMGYDIILYLTKQIPLKNSTEMILHHTLLFIAAYFSQYDIYYYSRCLLCEVSTIFLNLRWFAFKKIYFKNIILYSILLYITFIICRIINISNLLIEFYNKKLQIYLCVGGLFFILNIYWIYELTKRGITMYKELYSNK